MPIDAVAPSLSTMLCLRMIKTAQSAYSLKGYRYGSASRRRDALLEFCYGASCL